MPGALEFVNTQVTSSRNLDQIAMHYFSCDTAPNCRTTSTFFYYYFRTTNFGELCTVTSEA